MTELFQDFHLLWLPWDWAHITMSYEAAWAWATILGILLIAVPLLVAVAMIIYADRKIWAAMALRRGPNVVGPWGLLQSFADGLKVFLQETIVPSAANKGLFLLAPIVTFTVALMAWAVIPFNSGAVLADINVGLLYVLAISSLGVYGVVMAGWASNSKYPFFSAMRAAAQMISYEVSIGFILICVVLWAGSFNLNAIVEAQRGHGLGIVNGFWFNPLLFPMWVMFLISGMAETARAPFDLTEAESELVAGYQTEYSSMAFAAYWLGEYANVLLMCALNATLFFGGWLPPVDWAPLYWVPGWLWLFIKIFAFFFVFSWVKATVPRYRYDQLMRLGWKVFLPVSLLFVVLVSGWLMWTKYGSQAQVVINQPTPKAMLAMGATDYCKLNYITVNGEQPKWARTIEVMLHRDIKGNVFTILSPSNFAGRLRFEVEQSSELASSGSLNWISPRRQDQFGWGQGDLYRPDHRASGTLSLSQSENSAWIGSCASPSELEKSA